LFGLYNSDVLIALQTFLHRGNSPNATHAQCRAIYRQCTLSIGLGCNWVAT